MASSPSSGRLGLQEVQKLAGHRFTQSRCCRSDRSPYRRNWRLPPRAETSFKIAPEPRVVTEAALLCGCQRQLRLRRKPMLRFAQPELTQRYIGHDAALIEKAAPQGSQADPEPLRRIAR
jgi:hypothetical protein